MISIKVTPYYTLYCFKIKLGVLITKLPNLNFSPTYLRNYNNLILTNLFNTKDLIKILKE